MPTDRGHGADDPDLNRRVAQFPLKQNEIAGRIVDAMVAKDLHGMNTVTQELADLKAAHQDLAEDIAKYKADAGIEPVDAAPASPQSSPNSPGASEDRSDRLAKKCYTESRSGPAEAGPRARATAVPAPRARQRAPRR
jgi:hypothetical protein